MSEWRWLESTRRLQEESFGVDYARFAKEAPNPELADYLTWNVTALVAELGEFLQEVGWKPWTTRRGWVYRERAVKELVDVAHFLANLICALGVTDDEWEQRYRLKQEVNAQRQAHGYDGVTGKCEGCKRALDDDGVTIVNGQRFCSGCGKLVA
jgi:hypothetical protein